MGWIREEDGLYDARGYQQHEGYTVGVLAAGTVPTYRIGDHIAERNWWGQWSGGEAGIPEEPAVALRPACGCGWRGTDVPLEPGREFDEDQEEPARQQWNAHIDAVLAAKRGADSLYAAKRAIDAVTPDPEDVHPVDALAALHELERYIERRIATSVGEARAMGVPWSRIGAALGVAKQSAHRKYALSGDTFDDAGDTDTSSTDTALEAQR